MSDMKKSSWRNPLLGDSATIPLGPIPAKSPPIHLGSTDVEPVNMKTGPSDVVKIIGEKSQKERCHRRAPRSKG